MRLFLLLLLAFLQISAFGHQATAQTWSYETENDELRSERREYAKLRSVNAVNLGSPYGATRANILVRLINREKISISIDVDRGQILNCRGLGPSSIALRFDDRSVENFSCVESSDYSSDIVFISPRESAFYERLKSGSRLIIELTFYQGGAQQFRFNVAGLKLPSLAQIEAEREVARVQREAQKRAALAEKAEEALSGARPGSFARMQENGVIGDWWVIGGWARASNPAVCELGLAQSEGSAFYPHNFWDNVRSSFRTGRKKWGYAGMNLFYQDAVSDPTVVLHMTQTGMDSFTADIYSFSKNVLSHPQNNLLERGVEFVRCQ